MLEDEGSYGAGFALGLLLGIIGIIIAAAIGKKQTLKGSATGMLVWIFICIVISCSSGIY